MSNICLSNQSINAWDLWEQRPSIPHGEVLGSLREEEEPAETQTMHSAFIFVDHSQAF